MGYGLYLAGCHHPAPTMTEPTEPTASPLLTADEAAVAAFEQRVLTRDVPPVPPPLRFDAASVQQRLETALRRRLPQQRDPRRVRKLALVCYGFVAQPTQHSTDPDLLAALGCSSAGLLDVWAELRTAGLMERFHGGRARYYRLTRAGEDWLLAVVKGEEGAAPLGGTPSVPG